MKDAFCLLPIIFWDNLAVFLPTCIAAFVVDWLNVNLLVSLESVFLENVFIKEITVTVIQISLFKKKMTRYRSVYVAVRVPTHTHIYTYPSHHHILFVCSGFHFVEICWYDKLKDLFKIYLQSVFYYVWMETTAD